MDSGLDLIAARVHERLSAMGIPPTERLRYLAELAELTAEDAEGVLQGTGDPGIGDLERIAERLQTSVIALLRPIHGDLRC